MGSSRYCMQPCAENGICLPLRSAAAAQSFLLVACIRETEHTVADVHSQAFMNGLLVSGW